MGSASGVGRRAVLMMEGLNHALGGLNHAVVGLNHALEGLNHALGGVGGSEPRKSTKTAGEFKVVICSSETPVQSYF